MPRAQRSSNERMRVGEELDRLQRVVQHHRLVDVQLEVALRAARTPPRCRCRTPARATIVSASLCVGLILPGMIDEPGSLSGMRDPPKPARGPLAYQRTSLAIFIATCRSVRSGRAGVDHRVVRRQRRELVRRAEMNGLPVSFAISRAATSRRSAPSALRPGADRGAAERERIESRRARGQMPRWRRRAAPPSPRSPGRA